MSHHDVPLWRGNLLWYRNEERASRALAIYEEVLRNAREGQPNIDFPNCMPNRPVEWRYPEKDKLAW